MQGPQKWREKLGSDRSRGTIGKGPRHAKKVRIGVCRIAGLRNEEAGMEREKKEGETARGMAKGALFLSLPGWPRDDEQKRRWIWRRGWVDEKSGRSDQGPGGSQVVLVPSSVLSGRAAEGQEQPDQKGLERGQLGGREQRPPGIVVVVVIIIIIIIQTAAVDEGGSRPGETRGSGGYPSWSDAEKPVLSRLKCAVQVSSTTKERHYKRPTSRLSEDPAS